MKFILHKAEERGQMNIGWLNARYSFSFSRYYDPNKMGFGYLRVLNDDIIAPSGGFDTHKHDNMEIITIPLSGSLAHKDSTGGEGVITSGEVQVMSAGSGVFHSEFNPSQTESTNLLQIWITTQSLGITPRYEQKKFDFAANSFTKLVSGLKELSETEKNGSLWINQTAEILVGSLESGQELEYKVINQNSYVYVFVIEGEVTLSGESKEEQIILNKRDAAGLLQTNSIFFTANKQTKLLIIDMDVSKDL